MTALLLVLTVYLFIILQIKRYHELILCDYEKDSEDLTRYLGRCCLLSFSRPYGINRKFWCQGTIRPSHTAIDVIRALINFHVNVHEAGYAFNGQLSITDLYWLPRAKSVKISASTVRGIMVNRTEPGVNLDFKSLSSTITNKVFRPKVPNELKHLLELMTKDPVHHINLIKHNIVLLDDEDKVARYIILHQKLVLAKTLDEKIYWEALKYLKCGICNELMNWQTAILYHPALLKVFNFKNNELLPADEEGVSIYGRHCCHHLLKYAVEDEDTPNQKHSIDAQEATMNDDSKKDIANRGKQEHYHSEKSDEKCKTIKFSLADVFPLMECFIPGLFSQLQEAVFEIIEILYPQKLQMLISKTTGGA